MKKSNRVTGQDAQEEGLDNKEKEIFKANKARTIISCDACDAPCVVYSIYEPGVEDGPKNKNVHHLEQFIEDSGFIYRN